MTSSATCAACGVEIASPDDSQLCLQCKTKSVVFTGWDDPTVAALPQDTGTELLREGIFVGNERFKLLTQLGRGGMGVVWLAEDCRLRSGDQNSLVALKFLAPSIRSHPTALRLMQQEVLQSRRLRHRHIISVYDWHSEEANLPFISMEYVEGETLTQCRMRQPGRIMSWRQLYSLVVQLCEALDYAHSTERIIHRDLKPGNLMVETNGLLRLADFGLAGPTAYGAAAATAGRATGTLAYMSPQQFAGRPPHPSDDIYSLGSTLYELLTGTPPFPHESLPEQLTNDELPPSIPDRLSALGLQNPVPGRLLLLIGQCLQKNPVDRPGSVREILRALPVVQAANLTSSSTPRLDEFEIAPTREPDHNWVWSLVLMLVVGGIGWGAWMGLKPREDANLRQPPVPPISTDALNDPVASTNTSTGESDDSKTEPILVSDEASIKIIPQIDTGVNANFIVRVFNAAGETVGDPIQIKPKDSTTRVLPPGNYLVEVTCQEKASMARETKVTQSFVLRGGEHREWPVSFLLRHVKFETDLPQATVRFTALGERKEIVVRPDRPQDSYAWFRPGLYQFTFEAPGYLDDVTNLVVEGATDSKARPFPVLIQLKPRLYAAVGHNWSGSTLSSLGLSMVWIDPFWMSAREVTRAKFSRFVGESGRQIPPGMVCVTTNGWVNFPNRSWQDPGFPQGGNHPVVGVNWEDARAFCVWLTDQDRREGRLKRSQRYRLPTSAEFDRAALGFVAGPGRGNYAGDEVHQSGWNAFWEVLRNDKTGLPINDGYPRTSPTGSNPDWCTSKGLFDLGGNVAEWCEDAYRPDLNRGRPGASSPYYRNPPGPSARVVRGGSWFNEQPDEIGIDTVSHRPAEARHDWLGFRVLLEDSSLSQASTKP